MIVMKFGGSSLADAQQIHKALQIVRSRTDRSPVVVCSAHKGITDALIAATRLAVGGTPNVEPVVARQRSILQDLGCPPDLLDGLFAQLEDLLRGVALLREASPRTLDFVQGFGERMSVRAIADYFTRNGLPASPHDAFDLGFITDANFGAARPVADFRARAAAAFAALPAGVVPIVTGFVGKTECGDLTTVGRNGSDYTATCFAAALDATECEIWTDTDGVMTADPRVVAGAKSIPEMSFAEASELAYYGGRVLHPSTLLPAIERNVPVRVLNTNRPEHPGTVITRDGSPSERQVTSITYKERQAVLTIESTRMLGQVGFLAKIFDEIGRAGLVIDMISTSEVTVSMTTGQDGPNLEQALALLSSFGRATVERGKTIVCVVGKNVRNARGLSARVFAALERVETNVEMISMGANKINLSFLIDDREVQKVIPELHRALFG
ncbi:MAG: aspartate kinase [Deltaproteobacteria bacterium]|nr:aspartate kinase [Deltaproteobacteria bacterium]